MSRLMVASSKGSRRRSGTYREYKFSGTIERRKQTITIHIPRGKVVFCTYTAEDG